jgi:hypothetical protein
MPLAASSMTSAAWLVGKSGASQVAYPAGCHFVGDVD